VPGERRGDAGGLQSRGEKKAGNRQGAGSTNFAGKRDYAYKSWRKAAWFPKMLKRWGGGEPPGKTPCNPKRARQFGSGRKGGGGSPKKALAGRDARSEFFRTGQLSRGPFIEEIARG